MKLWEFGIKFYATTEHKLEGRSWELSEARKDAIKQAGLWNDPTKREAAILHYMLYDQSENKGK